MALQRMSKNLGPRRGRAPTYEVSPALRSADAACAFTAGFGCLAPIGVLGDEGLELGVGRGLHFELDAPDGRDDGGGEA